MGLQKENSKAVINNSVEDIELTEEQLDIISGGEMPPRPSGDGQ